MGGTVIKAGAVVEHCIVAENVVIGENAIVGSMPKDEEDGVATIGSGSQSERAANTARTPCQQKCGGR